MADVMIDGQWAHSFAQVSAVKWSGRWGEGACGPEQASFTIDLDPGNDSSWLRIGRVVEVWDAGVKVFGGKVSEMGRGTPREIHAKGWARYVEPGMTVAGQRWGRDVDNVTFTPTDPTTPTWLLDASNLDIGVADDSLFTRVVAAYVSAYSAGPPEVTTKSTVTVNDAAAQVLYDVITYEMDLTPLGLISSGTATTYAQAQLDQLTIPQWLNPVAANGQILLTPGGHSARLADVKEGQMVRLFNVPNNLGGIRNELALDVILGQVDHDAENPDEVTIAPVRIAVRNLTDALVPKEAA